MTAVAARTPLPTGRSQGGRLASERQRHRRAHRAQPASTSPASPCSSPTSPSSPCCSRPCSSTSSAPASSSPTGAATPDFAIAGMLALNLTTSAMGTAVGLSNDLNGGIIDRFRYPSHVATRRARRVGPSPTCLTAAMCAFFVCVTGLVRRLAAGGERRFRPWPASPSSCCSATPSVVGLRLPRDRQQGPGVRPGARPRRPVPPRHRLQRPRPDRPHARRRCARSPIGTRSAPSRPPAASSSTTPTPRPPMHAWPMQHPIAASLLWSVAMIVVFAPLAAHLFIRRTRG